MFGGVIWGRSPRDIYFLFGLTKGGFMCLVSGAMRLFETRGKIRSLWALPHIIPFLVLGMRLVGGCSVTLLRLGRMFAGPDFVGNMYYSRLRLPRGQPPTRMMGMAGVMILY
jgi:hypothetical protein